MHDNEYITTVQKHENQLTFTYLLIWNKDLLKINIWFSNQ